MNRKIDFRTRTPLGGVLIAGFYLIGAIVLLISIFTNPTAVSRTIADVHGLPPAADAGILPIVAGVALLIAYGLYTKTRWGYFLTMIYLLIFGGINFWLMSQNFQQPYIGNSTWSVLVLFYLAWKRKYFLST
jgi:hypothetical protein